MMATLEPDTQDDVDCLSNSSGSEGGCAACDRSVIYLNGTYTVQELLEIVCTQLRVGF